MTTRGSWPYRLWRRLLPKRLADRYAGEMSELLAVLTDDARRESGWRGVSILWIKEIGELAKLGLRQRVPARQPLQASPRPGTRFSLECRWAWRSVLARRSRAVLSVALIGVALAANALVFAAADAFVFHRVLYRDPERIVEIQS